MEWLTTYPSGRTIHFFPLWPSAHRSVGGVVVTLTAPLFNYHTIIPTSKVIIQWVTVPLKFGSPTAINLPTNCFGYYSGWRRPVPEESLCGHRGEIFPRPYIGVREPSSPRYILLLDPVEIPQVTHLISHHSEGLLDFVAQDLKWVNSHLTFN